MTSVWVAYRDLSDVINRGSAYNKLYPFLPALVTDQGNYFLSESFTTEEECIKWIERYIVGAPLGCQC